MRNAAVAIILFGLAHSAVAAGIPEGLKNKTIHASATYSTPVQGTQRIALANKNVNYVIYVSALGRIFARSVGRSPAGGEGRERAPDSNNWRYAGRNLVLVVPGQGGATMTQISLDANFSSCTISGLIGNEPNQTRKWTGTDGRQYIAAGAGTVSGQGCSISSGNGL